MVDWRAYIYNKVWTLGLFFLLFSEIVNLKLF